MDIKITLIYFVSVVHQCLCDLQDEISRSNQDKPNILSRKRRYLAFPEGTSLQMIFDLVYPSITNMGDLIEFGNTAVMAWKLPNKPFFMDKKKLEEMQNETKNMEDKKKDGNDYYEQQDLPEQWNHYEYQGPLNYDEHDYDNNHVWNPNDQNFNFHDKRRNLYDYEDPLFSHQYFDNPKLHHLIHRRSRRDLYGKIEKLFTAFKKDGKACLLKAICQLTQFPKEKGSLIVEILKAIFKPRHYDKYPDQDQYDLNVKQDADCEKLFPTCEGSILSHIFVEDNKK